MAVTMVTVVGACGGAGAPARTPQQRDDDSAAAVKALQASRFDAAHAEATTVLGRDPQNSRAAVVRAIAGYQRAGHTLIEELGDIIERAEHLEFFDHAGGRAAWQAWLGKLEAIDADLAVAAAEPGFSLELCIACWEHDWNRSGQIDERDRLLFQLERDGKGDTIPEGDPRRKPTYRFDVGDVEWARAMISFQRAFGELVLAYKWSELDKLFTMFGTGASTELVIRLTDKPRVQRARTLILAGLAHAERCRAAYLAESDDDREWVPNPRQKSYAMPLEVDDRLYETWAAVLGDVRRMLNSEEGLSIRELAKVADDDLETRAPAAFIDLGRMLSEPADIRIDLSLLLGDNEDRKVTVEKLLRGLLGNGYQTSMRASPLVGRLRHMKEELDRGTDTFERKLRYLLWLN